MKMFGFCSINNFLPSVSVSFSTEMNSTSIWLRVQTSVLCWFGLVQSGPLSTGFGSARWCEREVVASSMISVSAWQ